MAFLLPILEGVGSGLLGNAIGGAVGGGLAGGAQNGAMNALNSQDEGFQLGIYASEVQNQEQMQIQSEVFDQMMNERSENMREVDTLRNVDMAQRKADDSITKKFIQSIGE
jgi:outer membrane lipoprotein SlyB